MRLLLAGDFHGNLNHARRTCAVAKQHKADAIVQLGDFGFVWHDPTPRQERHGSTSRLDSLNTVLADFDLPLYWLDGNHENFDAMERLGARTDLDHMVKLGTNVTYIPRGYVWEWGGVRFLAMGGAYSIDKEWRVPGKEWWPQEMITPNDCDRAVAHLDGATVDVMLAHDAPELPSVLADYMRDDVHGDYKMDRDSQSNRTVLRALMDVAVPELYVHGHMHHRYDDVLNATTVAGLGRDGMGSASWLCLDTNALDLERNKICDAA